MTTDLRESLARALADEDAATRGKEPYTDTSWGWSRDRWLVKADRLLAGPLAPLLAKLRVQDEIRYDDEKGVI